MFGRRNGLDLSAARRLEARFHVAISADDLYSSLPVPFRDTVSAAYTAATKALERAEQVDSRLRGIEDQRLDPDALVARLTALEREFDRLAAQLLSSHNFSFHRKDAP
jgi:hypothetical protein